MKEWNTPTEKVLAVSVIPEQLEQDADSEVITLDADGKNEPPVGKNITHKQKEEIHTIVQEFHDVFSPIPGHTKMETHEIRTDDSRPVRLPPYRIPVAYIDPVREELRSMLSLGIIEPSKSPWSSPIVTVKKKDGGVRICGDYRRLNDVTSSDVYYMPRPEELIDRMGNSKFVTKLDMTKGFYQVSMNETDKEKTAFVTPLGKFQFTRMPFGLKNSPSTFQRLVDKLLDGTQAYAAGYIDDVAVFSNSWEDHLQHLREVLLRLRESGLTLRAEKCLIGASSCTFLGHEVGKGKISPTDAKIEAVRTFVRPKTKKDLKAFLGLTGYYRRFIDRYADRAMSLTDALVGTKPDILQWTTQMITDFSNLKQSLLMKPVLRAPYFELPFILQTDASARGIGAVLGQQFEEGEKPVAFFSKKLNPAQVNYTATEKECLAVVLALKHFEFYLLGNRFILQTDHKALKKLKTMNNDNPRLQRWSIAVQRFDFDVKYKPGPENTNADGLSRQDFTDPELRKERGDVRDSSAEDWLT